MQRISRISHSSSQEPGVCNLIHTESSDLGPGQHQSLLRPHGVAAARGQ